jgi:hypothetical protein
MLEAIVQVSRKPALRGTANRCKVLASPTRIRDPKPMMMHFWDHQHIEHTAASLPDDCGDVFKQEVLRRLHRLSKYPTSLQVQTVVDAVLRELKPPPERAQWGSHVSSDGGMEKHGRG